MRIVARSREQRSGWSSRFTLPRGAAGDAPECPNAVRLAVAELAKGEAAAATRRLEQAAGQCRDSKELHFWLGQGYRRQDRVEPARRAFQRFAALDPRNADGPRYLAELLLDERRFSEAHIQLEKAATLDPASSTIRDLLETTKAAIVRPNIGTPPPAPASSAPAPAPSAATSAVSELQGTFGRVKQEGIAGMFGARHAWWKRGIALVLFILVSVIGVVVRAAIHGSSEHGISFWLVPSAVLLGSLVYVGWWGTPQGATWGFLIFYGMWFANATQSAVRAG